MWSIIRAKRLAGLKFRRQHVIGSYIADFVCLPAKLVIEIDGDTHGSDEAQLRDAKRADDIERVGFRVIRFWNDYVLNDADGGLEDMILEALMASALPESEKARLREEGYLGLPAVASSPLSPTLSPERGEGDAASSPLSPTLSPELNGEREMLLPRPSPGPSPLNGERETLLPRPSPRPSPLNGERETLLPGPSPRPSPLN